MRTFGLILSWIIELLILIIIVRVLIDWLPVRWPPWLRPVLLAARRITEPLLAPLRRIIPMVRLSGGMGLDLSPTVLILLLIILQRIVARFLF
jgi:YggT family protein